ncbi:MAG: heparinase II/III family protein [Ignavibacteriae bacterium]|nr:heparinase II/III family protein [Ignavibacteriota bacterium]
MERTLDHYRKLITHRIVRPRWWRLVLADQLSRLTAVSFRKLFPYRAPSDEWLEDFHKNARFRFYVHPRNQKDFFLHQLTQTQSQDQILQEAGDVLENKFQTLGSSTVSLGSSINWQLDFKSGKEWPLAAAGELDLLDLTYHSDVKVPWELSRFHQVWWLGKAYWLTRNEQYAEKFRDLVNDWIDQNPIGKGVNWVIAMEVSIRACNWIAGYYFFCESKTCSSDFWIKLLKSLYTHGLFIRNNLEYSRKSGNHFLSNLVGLVFLGVLFSDTRFGKEWLHVGVQSLTNELPCQVTPDGVDYEKSTSYQQLVLEFFTAATILCQRNKIRFSESYMKQLESMFEYVQHYTRPDGSIPLVGDADDGRLFRFSMNDNINDHRHMLSVGAVLFNRSDFKHAAGKFSQDALWYFGGEGFEKYQLLREEPRPLASQAFPHGGFYVMRGVNAHVFIDAGDIGMNGRGGHGHNDTFSFELWVEGRPFIVDSGTYAYTFDVEARQAFRSTRAHNTIMIDDREIAEFAGLWSIKEDLTSPKVLQWKTSGESDILEAEHYGYARLSQPVTHRRKYEFDKQRTSLAITDTLSGTGTHVLQMGLHLHPEVAIEQTQGKQFTISSEKVRLRIELSENAHVVDSYYSPSYGMRIPNKAIQVRVSAQLPVNISTMISRG